MIDKWKEYISQLEKIEGKKSWDYIYPITDEVVDAKVSAQDASKIKVEKSLISKSLEWDWKIVMDFGCGIGAQFPLFNNETNKDKFLIGVDPDESRIIKASKYASKTLKNINYKLIHGGINVLEKAPSGLTCDYITCIQVLGHISKRMINRILNGFYKILSPKGRCTIAFPIIGEDFKNNVDALGWDGSTDFNHLVDFNFSPGEKGYRKLVSLEVFNKKANKPREKLLPVRCFLIKNFPDANKIKTPFELNKVPETVANYINDKFSVEKAIIYSIHVDDKNKIFPIGDMMIYLKKK